MAGLVLALLACALLIWGNWARLSRYPVFVDVLHCTGTLAAVILPCAAVLVPVRFLTRVPIFVFRKAMHTVAFAAVTLMIVKAESWQAAALTAALAAGAAFTVLSVLEGEAWYDRLLVQKRPGELRRSLASFFAMVAALVALCWGAFDRPGAVSAAILMWGAGDAAAALVGIPFGRHKVRHADGKKSWEGSLAMLAVSFVCGLCMLTLVQKVPLPRASLFAGMGALLGTATELYSPGEWDTLTVPAAIAAALLFL